jgi:hypothetical protein
MYKCSYEVKIGDKTRQDKIKTIQHQDNTTPRQDQNESKTTQDKTRQDKTRQDKTRQDKTRQDKTRQDKTRQGRARLDKTIASKENENDGIRRSPWLTRKHIFFLFFWQYTHA